MLAKTTAIWHVPRLRLSETSKDIDTYCTFELGLLERLVVFRALEGGKVLPVKDKGLFNGKAKPYISDLLSMDSSGTSIAVVPSLTYNVGKVEL
jgi:hypothetical protein